MGEVSVALDTAIIAIDGAEAERDRCFGNGACASRPAHHHIRQVRYQNGDALLICEEDEYRADGSIEFVERSWLRHQSGVAERGQVHVRVEAEPEPDMFPFSYTRDSVVEHTEESIEEAFGLLRALAVMQSKCTCAEGDIEDCPNYVEGDEVPLDSTGRVEE